MLLYSLEGGGTGLRSFSAQLLKRAIPPASETINNLVMGGNYHLVAMMQVHEKAGRFLCRLKESSFAAP
jgi:hypothetical protein